MPGCMNVLFASRRLSRRGSRRTAHPPAPLKPGEKTCDARAGTNANDSRGRVGARHNQQHDENLDLAAQRQEELLRGPWRDS